MEIHYLFYGINTFIWGVLDWILFVGLFMTLAIDFRQSGSAEDFTFLNEVCGHHRRDAWMYCQHAICYFE